MPATSSAFTRIEEVLNRPDVLHVIITAADLTTLGIGSSLREEIICLCAITPTILVIDLSQVQFLGADFVEAAFRLRAQFQKVPGKRWILCGLNPYALDVLQLTHCDKLFTIQKDLEEVLSTYPAK